MTGFLPALIRLAMKVAVAVLATAAALPPVAAQGRLLADEELAEVSGQGLLEPSNYSYNGLDFTRITLGADIQLSANLSGIRLGEYNRAIANGSGADIDIPLLRIGRSDGTDAQRIVQITDPYVEFVFRNGANAATRELVGARFGFGGIKGEFGVDLAAISGSLRIDAGAAGVIDSNQSASSGVRWDGTCVASCLPLSQLGSLTAGDANGPSRDFWLSMSKLPVNYAPIAGVAQQQAAMGFWMNWRDRLAGGNIGLGAPPNLPKPGG